jgi:hypothetical protein
MTPEERELVDKYGADPRWRNAAGLRRYMREVPLTPVERAFYKRLLAALVKSEG